MYLWKCFTWNCKSWECFVHGPAWYFRPIC